MKQFMLLIKLIICASALTANAETNKWFDQYGDILKFKKIQDWRVSPDNNAIIDHGKVTKTGKYSCALSYQFIKPGNSGQANETISLSPVKKIVINSDVKYIGVWIHSDGAPHRLYFKFIDADKEHLLNISSEGPQIYRNVMFKGWKYFELDLEKDYFLGWGSKKKNNKINYPVEFSGIVLDDMGKGEGRGQLVFDQIVFLHDRNKEIRQSAPLRKDLNNTVSPIKIQSNLLGNLSYGENDIDFDITIKNISHSKDELYRVTELTDFFNKQLYYDRKKLLLNGDDSKTFNYKIDRNMRGFFKLKCSIENSSEVLAQQEVTCGVFDPPIVKNPDKSPYGIYYWFIGHPKKDLLIINKMGFRWARFDMRWDLVEKKKGQMTWGTYDQVLNYAQKNDLRMVPGLYYVPKWAAAKERHFYGGDPADYKQFAKFSGMAAKRYKDIVNYWEIWNEPDAQAHWTAGPEKYAELLKLSYKAIKHNNPNAKVVFGGVTGHEKLWKPFVEKCFTAGGKKYFDIYDYHYGAGADSNPNFEMGAKHRNMLKKFGLDKKIWNTEESSWPIKTLKFAVLSLAEGVDKYFFFLFRITAGDEEHTTLVKKDYSPRFNFVTMYTFLNALSDLKYIGNLSPDGDFRIYHFSNDNTDRLVAWAQKSNSSGIKTTTEQISVTDYSGEKYELHSFENIVSIPLDKMIYIDKEKMKITKPLITFPHRNIKFYPGENKTVSIKLWNPSKHKVKYHVKFELSDSWDKGKGEQIVELAPGSTGKAEVSLIAPDKEQYMGYRLYANLYVNGKLCGFDRIGVDVNPPLKISCHPGFAKNEKQVEIVIENPSSKLIKGTLEIYLPIGWRRDGQVPFAISPKSTKTISWSIPSSIKILGKEKFPVRLVLSSKNKHVKLEKKYQLNWIKCFRIANTPVINADLNDWKRYSDSRIVLNSRSAYKAYSSILFPWTGIKDLSVIANMRCDNKYLYFMADVVDDKHCQSQDNGATWQEDSLQLMIGNDVFDLALSANKALLYCHNPKVNISKFRYAAKRKDNHTYYEMAIPLKELPVKGNSFKFSFIVNDSDGREWRKGWMYWITDIGTISQRKNTQIIYLGDK